MNKQLIKAAFGWGIILWFIGYVLGFILYFIVPSSFIGWIIMPIGILITLSVLLKKVPDQSFNNYLFIAVIWTVIAVAFDYFFLVKLLKPTDGYYKLDVYLYYASTLMLPVIMGLRKIQSNRFQ